MKNSKGFLIAVDSDGCVIDNMTYKHMTCFYPAILETFNLEDKAAYKEIWETINLSYPLRGVNRFVGLYLFLSEIDASLPLEAYGRWVKSSEQTSKQSLMDYRTRDDHEERDQLFLKKVCSWSDRVDQKVASSKHPVRSFEGVKETLSAMAALGDLVVVSSANRQTVLREWQDLGLGHLVHTFYTQEDGTKTACLKALVDKGYKKNHCLMVGDADLDFQAAREAGIHFYRIDYKKEVRMWDKLRKEVLWAFKEGTYQYKPDELLHQALSEALKVVAGNLPFYGEAYQHVAVDGVYPKMENKLWTMSFYPGASYLAYAITKNEDFLRNRQAVLESFSKRCQAGHMATHDIGFLFELTAYYDYRLTGNPASRDLVLRAADKLMDRFHDKGGYIQAWGPMEPKPEKTRIIIDCMMNLPLLFIASELSGEAKYKEAAIRHAKVSATTLVRKDYTSYHTYWMDTSTGQPLMGATHQGNRDESTWARGQAWCLYGFAKAYIKSGEAKFLQVSKEAAKVFLSKLPLNDICYWDFDYTDDHPDIRDSSAAAIAACGLLELSQINDLSSDLRQRFRQGAIRLLTILATRYQNVTVYEGAGLIREGMYHRHDGADTFTSWGDYYYLEALIRLRAEEGIKDFEALYA